MFVFKRSFSPTDVYVARLANRLFTFRKLATNTFFFSLCLKFPRNQSRHFSIRHVRFIDTNPLNLYFFFFCLYIFCLFLLMFIFYVFFSFILCRILVPLPTMPRRPMMTIDGFPDPRPRRLEPEIEKKLKEIMTRSGIVTIDGIEYKTDIKDLDDLGELGNGTSGHVVKMRHTPTNKPIAVKVISSHFPFSCTNKMWHFYFVCRDASFHGYFFHVFSPDKQFWLNKSQLSIIWTPEMR